MVAAKINSGPLSNRGWLAGKGLTDCNTDSFAGWGDYQEGVRFVLSLTPNHL